MGATHTLQDKLEPTIEALIADGTIAGVEVDRSLEKATGAGYIADFLATTPSGAVIDIEVDHPAHHDKGLDDARDEALVVCGISTIRVSAFELDDGKAEGKIRDAIALCEKTGKPLQAGSTRVRKVKAFKEPVPGLPDVGVYIRLWHQANSWGWAACTREINRNRRKRGPKYSPGRQLSYAGGGATDPDATRNEMALRALCDERLWAGIPTRSNVYVYISKASITEEVAASSEELREAVGKHNLVSAQSVTQAQRVSECGTNFAVLNELDPEARAFARDEAERARAAS